MVHSAPYSNRWFIVPTKSGTLCFIQDQQLVNKVTIRNLGFGSTIDEFVEALTRRSIYSVGDLYSRGLSELRQDESALCRHPYFRRLVGTRRTLPQERKNLVAHMVNAMSKVLRDYIPDITMPFLDNILIKGCSGEAKNESIGTGSAKNL